VSRKMKRTGSARVGTAAKRQAPLTKGRGGTQWYRDKLAELKFKGHKRTEHNPPDDKFVGIIYI